ncbi:uncharacterized protein LOC108414189 [Pygocentrus nattereri]|uniref:uncharacterized protein LOC108414189 n=1 Tax=Pygocentrus nattereri TaxID=42514 RepID=UPI0008146505|nr:uncharacterized protein LOC108414189 [Pygocentrus nattereri]
MSADVQSLYQTPEEKKTPREELLEALENLGPYSNVIDKNGATVLNCLPSIVLSLGASGTCQAFKWITTEVGKVLCLNLVRYFCKTLKKSEVSEEFDLGSEDGELHGVDRELHIVLVGKGSISDQTHPANRLVPLKNITDTILYPPWNCAIDGNVAYGISAGCILPEHRVFRNGEPQGPLPERWNSMAAQPGAEVPKITLGPMRNNADWMMNLTALAQWKDLFRDHRRLVIPYPPGGVFAKWLPEVALYKIIGVIAFLLWIFKKKATIHLAAGLEYRGTKPLDERKLQEQYAYTRSGTVMSTENMELYDFSTLYELLRTTFNEAHED